MGAQAIYAKRRLCQYNYRTRAVMNRVINGVCLSLDAFESRVPLERHTRALWASGGAAASVLHLFNKSICVSL